MDPIHGPILSILEKPFSRWNTFGKQDIHKQGKHTSSLTCLANAKRLAKY